MVIAHREGERRTPHVVIIGAGQAGAELAFAVRQASAEVRISLIGAESQYPYQRPPLSKALLHGALTPRDVRVRSETAYEAARIELTLGNPVTRVDRANSRLVLADGTLMRYDKLAFTTGGRPRTLDLGGDVTPALVLYSLDDAAELREVLARRGRLIIVGGGFIGLEVAAAAVGVGSDVTVVETQSRLLARTCAMQVGRHFERLHREHGVHLRIGTSVESAYAPPGGGVAVRLSDGSEVRADHLIAGIGQLPNDELARESGLAVDSGIVVDQYAQTSDPAVVAAGDCARQHHGFLNQVVRLESQQNATDQARTAARTLMGQPHSPSCAPWFWSDQYAQKLQMVGVPRGGDTEIVRGDPLSGSFTVLYLRSGTLVAVQAVDRPRDFAQGRKLINTRAVVDAGRCADEKLPLADSLAPIVA